MNDSRFDTLQHEYSQLNENLRHYHNQRFAQLTLWLALTAGLFSVLFSQSYEIKGTAKMLLKLVGLFSSIIFWIMDRRMVDHWRHFWKRLKEIEAHLGFKMWINRPKRKFFGSTNATWFLYGILILFWLFALIFPKNFK